MPRRDGSRSAPEIRAGGRGSRSGTSVIALTGFYGDSRPRDADLNFVIRSFGPDTSRDISQRVFVAGFFGDLRIELFDVGASGRVINVAPGIVGIVDQAREFVFGEAASDRQAVDRNVVVKKGSQRVLVGDVVELWSVYAIGNDEDHFAAAEAAVVKKDGGGVDGVVKGFGGS